MNLFRTHVQYYLQFEFSTYFVFIFVPLQNFSVKEVREGSDAVACSNLIPFCKPRCVGVQFLLVGLVFQVLGIYLALVWLISA